MAAKQGSWHLATLGAETGKAPQEMGRQGLAEGHPGEVKRDIKADVEQFSAEVMHEISGKCYFWQLTLEKIGDDRRYSEIPKVSSVSSIWALPGTGKHVSGAG